MATGSSPSRRQRHAAGTLSDSDLLALPRREEQAAAGHQDSALSAVLQEALAYYDRQSFGIEQEGRSQVVTSEFADVIESIMPGLMRVFTGTNDLATFAPLAPGQEKWARQASAYVPDVRCARTTASVESYQSGWRWLEMAVDAFSIVVGVSAVVVIIDVLT